MPLERVTPALRNPYVAPATGTPTADGPPASVERCGPRVLVWSLVLATVYAFIAGAVGCASDDFGLQRFGGLEYVPQVVGLSAIRAVGPGVAAMLSTLTAVVVLHRAGRRGVEAPAIDPRLPRFAGAAALLASPVAVCAHCLGALPVWCADSGETARRFMASMIDKVLWIDVACGIGATVVGALVVASCLRVVVPSLLSRRWSLFPKLLVAWVAVQVFGYAIGRLGGLLYEWLA
jgi:hypothetical protein